MAAEYEEDGDDEEYEPPQSEGYSSDDAAMVYDASDDDTDTEALFQCGDCSRFFRRRGHCSNHECCGVMRANDARSTALYLAANRLNSASMSHVWDAGRVPSLRGVFDKRSWIMNGKEPRLRLGWARRPKHGETLGVKYSNNFGEEIKEMWDRGEKEKAEKMSPGQMLSEILDKNPNITDLPGITDMAMSVQRVVNKGKATKKAAAEGATAVPPSSSHAPDATRGVGKEAPAAKKKRGRPPKASSPSAAPIDATHAGSDGQSAAKKRG